MTYLINNITYTLSLTDECDNDYTEYEVISADGAIGTICKYNEQDEYGAWNTYGKLVATRKTIKGAVKALISE